MGTKSLLTWEALDLISNTAILGIFYGTAFILYCLCARSLYLQLRNPDLQKQVKFTLGYITLVLLFATAYFALTVRMDQFAYVDHGDFPGAPLEFEESYNLTTDSYETAAAIVDLVTVVLTMAIQARRLWIIWSGTRYAAVVTTVSVLFLLSYIALDIPMDVLAGFLPLDQLRISDDTANIMDTTGYAVLSAFTITVTALVAGRILLVQRRHAKLMGNTGTSSPYLSIVAMLVESYALESAWSVAATVSAGLNSPFVNLFGENDSSVKVIAYFLVVYRVATGRGWTKQTEHKLTSLQWNHDAQATTDEVSGVRSRVPATISSPLVSYSGSAV